MTTAGLVLAAGQGRRFGGPKAPYELDGERLVDRAVRLLREAGVTDVIVVLGAWVGSVPHAQVVVNPDWATGMGSSLQAGLRHLAARPELSAVDRVVVTLVDLPGLTPAAIGRVASSGAAIAMATYHGERGHPVALARDLWDDVGTAASGDIGAKSFIAAHPHLVTLVECGDVATGEDMDVRPD